MGVAAASEPLARRLRGRCQRAKSLPANAASSLFAWPLPASKAAAQLCHNGYEFLLPSIAFITIFVIVTVIIVSILISITIIVRSLFLASSVSQRE